MIQEVTTEKNNEEREDRRPPKEKNLTYSHTTNFNDTDLANYTEHFTPERELSGKLNNSRHGDRRKTKESVSNWVTKVASGTEQYSIDIYEVLSQYDSDNDGNLTPHEMRFALMKMKFRLTEDDIDNMFTYFDIASVSKINIKNFSKIFMNNIVKKKSDY